MSRAEWMNGICLIWSRGRLISPSLPIGDDRYLNLSSQKRPTGRNLGGNRLVRRSGTTSRCTVVLVFCLRMRRFPLTLVLTISVGMKWIVSGQVDTWQCSCHLLVPVSLTCGRISHLPGWSELRSQNRPFCLTIAFAKCPKIAILRHFLKCCVLKIFGFI